MSISRRACTILAWALVLLLLSLSSMDSGAQVAEPVLSILKVQDSAFPEVQVTVSAADANGIPLQGLTEDNFLVVEDGRPAVINSIANSTGGLPLFLVLSLDVSGSMEGTPLQATTQAAATLVEGLATLDQAALIVFDDQISSMAPLSSDKADIVAALQGLRADGNTALYDAAHEAVTLLQGVPSGRRAVVLFTDGEDTSSDLTLEDAVDTARRFAVPLYVVGYGPNIQPDVLNRLATRTGGAFFQAPRLEDIPGAFAQVMYALRQAYQIRYLSSMPADGSDHELRVAVITPGGTTEAVDRVVARPGNLSLSMILQDVPDQGAAEQIWNALGQPPLDPAIPILSGRVTAVSQATGSGLVASTEFSLDGETLAEIPGTLAGTATTEASAPITAALTAPQAPQPPISYTWDSTATAPGLHTLVASAKDHVGNQATFPMQVAVVPPALAEFTSPAAGELVSGTVPISLAIAHVAPVAEVVLSANGEELHRFTGPPYQFEWTTWRDPPGDYTLLAALTTVDGFVVDDQRNVAIGPHISVSLVQPQPDQDLEGSVTLAADVRSDAPIDGVAFYVNDQEVGRASSSPYQIQLHTGDYAPGEYRFRAEASNQAGMVASTEVASRMVPTTRTGALGAALIGGLALLLIVPVVFVARRRRQEHQPVAAPVTTGAAAASSTATGERRQPAAWLLPVGAQNEPKSHPLYPGENRIGRNRDFADIWLPDLGVSRRHAILWLNEDAVRYQDLTRENPSLVNDRPVTGTVNLNEGDRVQIGPLSFVFSYQSGG